MRRLLTVVIFPLFVFAQADTIRISGFVKDRLGEPIPFTHASVYVGEQLITGAVADTNGYFSIQLNFRKGLITLCLQSLDKKKCFPILLDTIVSKPYDFQLYTPYSKVQLESIYQDAFKDIKKDRAIIYTFANNFPTNKITKKYGFRYKFVAISYDGIGPTDIPLPNELQLAYIETFNQYGYDYLEKRNGANWRELFEKEIKDYKSQ